MKKVKVTGTLKYGGLWYGPVDVIEGVKEEIAQQMVKQDVGEIIGESADKPDDKLQALRERAKELGVPRATQMGEAKLIEAIAAKEAELAGESGVEEKATDESPAEG